MNYLSTDYLIVYAFLFLTVIIGLWAGRKVTSIQDYIQGNRSFSTLALVLTILATDIGNNMINWGVESAVTQGLILAVGNMGIIVNCSMLGFVIGPRILRFKKCMTLGDIMRSLYDDYSSILISFIGFLVVVGLISAELHALGSVCRSVFGIKSSWGIALGGIFFALYTAYGGIRSVTATDVFQFIIFIVGIPMIAFLAVHKAGGVEAVFTQVPTEKLSVLTHSNFSQYLVLFGVCSLMPIGISSPIIIQRMLMARHPQQLRDKFLIFGIFSVTFFWLFVLIGFSSLVLYPTLAPNQIVGHLVHHLLPVGFKGVAMAALVGVSMSTLDSQLHIAGITIVHDVIKPICKLHKVAIEELRWIRWSIILVSVLAIGLAIFASSAAQLFLTSLSFQSSILVFPILAGIMGLRVDKYAFYIALVATLTAFVSTKLFLPAEYSHFAILLHTAVNMVVFMGVHIVQHGGIMLAPPTGQDELWHPPKTSSIFSQLKTYIPTPKRIVQYSQQRMQQYGAPYTLFGVFLAMNYTLPYFLWSSTPHDYQAFMMVLRLVGGIFCCLLIVEEKWYKPLKFLFPSFWHFTVMYCLPFTGTIMLLLTQGDATWLLNILATILLLTVLVDWVTAILLGVLGVSLGLLFHYLYIGPIVLILDFSQRYQMLYQLLFATLIGLLFARRKERAFTMLKKKHKRLLDTNEAINAMVLEAFKEKLKLVRVLQRSGVENLSKVAKMARELVTKEAPASDTKALRAGLTKVQEQLTPMALAVERITHRAADYLRLTVESSSLDELLATAQKKLQRHELHKQVNIKLHTQHKSLSCDIKYLTEAILNAVSLLRMNVDKEVPIYIHLADTKLSYKLHFANKERRKSISGLCISITTQEACPTMDTEYLVSMSDNDEHASVKIPDNAPELLLSLNRRIISAHYGHVVTSKEDKDYNYTCVIPTNLREVRPKDMDKPYMELGTELVRANDQYPGAQEQESNLIQTLEKCGTMNMAVIHTAIELIKWYHGPVNRKSGEPFYLHPISVAQIALEFNQEERTVLGALLHDTVEDTPMLLENIEMMFGKAVADIVDGVTHLESNKNSFYKVKLSADENITMLLEVTDKCVLYIKIADRIHNMRTIQAKPYANQRRTAEETLRFYVPLARHLGLTAAAEELKERGLEVLNREV